MLCIPSASPRPGDGTTFAVALAARRKRGVIDWKGQLLLKGPDDNAPVKLLAAESAGSTEPAAPPEPPEPTETAEAAEAAAPAEAAPQEE